MACVLIPYHCITKFWFRGKKVQTRPAEATDRPVGLLTDQVAFLAASGVSRCPREGFPPGSSFRLQNRDEIEVGVKALRQAGLASDPRGTSAAATPMDAQPRSVG